MSISEQKFLRTDQLSDAIAVVVGTRPGIVMMAPVVHALRDLGATCMVLHTGQHYSPNMDAAFFADLQLPQPDVRLDGVAEERTHGGQTAVMLKGVEQVLLERRPRAVLVGGDANTNLAAALAARKLHLRVGHVEAGERSYDWRMPEEHNRVIIDHISDDLFVTNTKAAETLKKEGVRGRIHITGNPIVDASHRHLGIARKTSNAAARFNVKTRHYGIMTLHREENVDDPDHLRGALEGASKAACRAGLEVLFLAHPRTEKRLRQFDLWEWALSRPALRLEPAVGYFDFLQLLSGARVCLTDSGGVQQEACIHRVPAVTLRENTEWTETLELGANRLAGCAPERIVSAVSEALTVERGWDNPFGDGNAARRIAEVVMAAPATLAA